MGNCFTKTTAPKKTLVAVILDGSASMRKWWRSNKALVQCQVSEVQGASPDGHVLLGVFCDNFRNRIKCVINTQAANAPRVEDALGDFCPVGGTPLNQATLQMITEVDATLAQLQEDGADWNVIFVIITDGVANKNDRQYQPQVAATLAEKQAKDHWRVMTLSGDPTEDAAAQGAKMGLKPSQCLNVDMDNPMAMASAASAAARCISSGPDVPIAFTPNERGSSAPMAYAVGAPMAYAVGAGGGGHSAFYPPPLNAGAGGGRGCAAPTASLLGGAVHGTGRGCAGAAWDPPSGRGCAGDFCPPPMNGTGRGCAGDFFPPRPPRPPSPPAAATPAAATGLTDVPLGAVVPAEL